MPHNPHADFTPTLKGYSGQEPFRFWCQLALPLTYDDSLSYYELLNKVVNYLNHTIEDVSNMESNVGALHDAYVKLQHYVNDYFDNIDIEAELRSVLDKMALDGSLDTLLDPLVANHLPEIVESQIDNVVAEQIDESVESQIGGVVAEQLPPLVDENIPDEVSGWLEENVDPVGSAVIVDSSLTISGAAADAKVTGDELSELKTQIGIREETTTPEYTATPGKQINPSGSIGGNENWSYSNFIELGNATQVSMNWTNDNQYIAKIMFYRKRGGGVDYTAYYAVGTGITNLVAGEKYPVPNLDGITSDYVAICYRNSDFVDTNPVLTLYTQYSDIIKVTTTSADIGKALSPQSVDGEGNVTEWGYETIPNTSEIETQIADLQSAIDAENPALGIVDVAKPEYITKNEKCINANGSEGTNVNWAHSNMIPIINATQVSINYTEDNANMAKIAFYRERDGVVKQTTYYVLGTPITAVVSGTKYDVPVVDGVKAEYVMICYKISDFPDSKPVLSLYGDPYSEVIKDSDILWGKKWYCCGDSYSAGDYSTSTDEYKFPSGRYKDKNKVYSRFIALRHHMDLRLIARTGATLGMRTDDTHYSDENYNPLTTEPSNTNNFFWTQLQFIEKDADYITLWFGINDSAYCELGTIDDDNIKTFYGALNWSFEQLLTRFPLAHIGIVVSYRCNSNYQQAVRDCAQKWAIPYLDTEGDVKIPTISGVRENQTIPSDSSLPTLRYSDNFKVSASNGHPNQKAHEYESTFIENWLRSL